jgi:hypothetical protein
MIYEYFNEIEYLLQFNPLILKSDTHRIPINDYSGIIKGIVHFDGFVLSFIEVLDLDNNPTHSKTKYKYHFMESSGSLIFRYDNVKHHPKLFTFPHHKHISTGITESNEPDLKYILKEIRNYIISTTL